MHCTGADAIRLILSATLLLGSAAVCSAQQSSTQVEHLLQATVHLEQADLPAQAAEIRELLASQDEQIKQRLLEAKLAQIEKLQVEVAQLQQALDSSDDRARVILRLKVLELSLGKLSQVGLSLVSIRQLIESDSPTALVDDGGDILPFLEMLQTQGFVEVIAEPTLVTRDGQHAAIEVGSTRQENSQSQIVYADPAAARRARGGSLRFECTPTVGKMGLLQLDLLLRRSSESMTAGADGDRATDVPSENLPAPAQQASTVQTRVEMLNGQTLILVCGGSNEQTDQAVVTLLLLRTEVVEKSQR